MDDSTPVTEVEHIEVEHKDPLGARIGMWLFLFTELILFGGLFLLYAVYRMQFTEAFHFSAGHLNSLYGTVNTLILLTSSLSVVLSIHALGRKQRYLSVFWLILTILGGVAFLVIKYFEWTAKFEHGLYPGSPELRMRTPGENLFFALYYAMTGLHGIHVVAGLVVLIGMLYLILRTPRKTVFLNSQEIVDLKAFKGVGKILWSKITVAVESDAENLETQHLRLENVGLYWHLVDVIWIFLFPLFYLIS